MRLRIFTEPQQGASYDDILAVAQATEALGFDAFFRSDHYMVMGDGGGLPGPTDAWTTLAGLARETSRIRLGTLVSSVTYRAPGILAIQVAQVDQMSGGRVELGLGTGWFEKEHLAYGIPFPAKRFGMLEEQLEIVTGLWETPVGDRYDFTGEHYTLVDSPALPKPAQQRVPVIVGGGGAKRTPALAARFATEFNLPFPEFADIPGKFAGVRAACATIGRDPGELHYSVALIAVAGRDESEFARRAAAVGREPAELREHGLAGTAAEIVDRLGALAEAGVDTVYLQIMDLADLDHLDFIAREVAPRLP
ncbi:MULTISPECIES: LLM class F420-dependent oxidoreductase [unclassified Cryobacterium]|uniref:LLM class F420-dependent oxidoreductase n=3 Tax=Cryobacterium TaxID=69578 RepID=UPI0010696E7C|nr:MULTISPECIES: LLM class F420-dependent oxidoreductase [unclassified Cryobacterium]MDY7529504.1 LLM class F420-dependent oxidoreductase [Cryobacterium sp. 10C2]MDY7558355.1 LLM class F420-dependent oxidoreductase [Cryobacterium sp. 10C3]MEB0203083.1 LLM class F420-dependent oxidoreductase [Cryobacterium sp. 5I3]MEB0285444.1 LLM class F420-dependent oxidoreductase [Cryobacterium sp. 10S3]MEB0291803.1 LLM class F420-dependent oxidoreductase [Cryobacterium sp. 10C2]